MDVHEFASPMGQVHAPHPPEALLEPSRSIRGPYVQFLGATSGSLVVELYMISKIENLH